MPRQKTREMWRVNKYIWISMGFVLAWFMARHEHYPATTQILLTWVLLAGFLNVGLRSWLAYRSPSGSSGAWGWVFSVGDILLIAAAVRLTGGLTSDLWLFYFLLIVTETLSVSVKAEIVLYAMTFAGYTAAVWPIPDRVTFVTRLFFLYVVSAIARRLYLNAEERNRQLVALREQLSVAEEKSRIARELHDGLGREIVNVILGLEVAKRVAEKQPAQVPELLVENIALLRTAMNDTRDLIFQTRPWVLEGEGCETLGDRIELYARQFAERAGVSVEVVCTLGDEAIGPQVVFGILRIVQEALNNVTKHAQAQHISVTLCRESDVLVVTVTDDGIGFSRNGAQSKSVGIGLKAMQERAADLGGRVTITSEPGKGAAVVARVPG